ncbi:MAG: hypothetical protein IJD86_04680 [Clostridia bacterium]|nr:hypothetical protein [Clostridia bacterium]
MVRSGNFCFDCEIIPYCKGVCQYGKMEFTENIHFFLHIRQKSLTIGVYHNGRSLAMADKLLKRSEVKVENTWRLEDIYENEEIWESDFSKAKEMIGELSKYEGKLQDEDKLLEMLKKNYDAERVVENLFCYARMLGTLPIKTMIFLHFIRSMWKLIFLCMIIWICWIF